MFSRKYQRCIVLQGVHRHLYHAEPANRLAKCQTGTTGAGDCPGLHTGQSGSECAMCPLASLTMSHAPCIQMIYSEASHLKANLVQHCCGMLLYAAPSTTHVSSSNTPQPLLAGVPSWSKHTPCCQFSSSSRAWHFGNWGTGRCSSQQAAAAAWHGLTDLQQHPAGAGGVGPPAGLCQATAAAGMHATHC